MSITNDIRKNFDNLMKTLVTNAKLEELLKSFQVGILKNFEHKIKEQNAKIEGVRIKISDETNCYW